MDNSDYFTGYEEKPTVWLFNWSVVSAPECSPYTAPEMVRAVLYGMVEGHPHHIDGTYVNTSRILASNGNEVETNNTLYKLGPMSKGYKDWCYSQGIDIDPKHPVKVKTA